VREDGLVYVSGARARSNLIDGLILKLPHCNIALRTAESPATKLGDDRPFPLVSLRYSRQHDISGRGSAYPIRGGPGRAQTITLKQASEPNAPRFPCPGGGGRIPRRDEEAA